MDSQEQQNGQNGKPFMNKISFITVAKKVLEQRKYTDR